MISKYEIFCKVMDRGSFTKAAEELGYSQSSVSQTVKGLENELGAVLIERKKDGIELTSDGRLLFPYIEAICTAEKALEEKRRELNGLANSVITIGTFTGISRTILPMLMKSFQNVYPTVSFILQQGEYTSIAEWIKSGKVDFGFVNQNTGNGIEMKPLYEEQMLAVAPCTHEFAKIDSVSLNDIANEPFILLDEGENSVPLTAFSNVGLIPNINYKVTDDYTILAMVRQGLGVSMIYERVLRGFEQNLTVRRIDEQPKRTIAVAYRNRKSISHAAGRFIDFIIKSIGNEEFDCLQNSADISE